MKSITKASRINAVTHVLQHMKSGMALVEVCPEVKVPRSYIGAPAVPYRVINTERSERSEFNC